MTISHVADRGSGGGTVASGGVVVTLAAGASIAVGNYLIARAAVDNSAPSGNTPALAVTDANPNSWFEAASALIDPSTPNAGSSLGVFYTLVGTPYVDGATITFTFTPDVAAKAIIVEEWAGIDTTTPIAVPQVKQSAVGTTGPTALTITPTAAGQLVYGAVGIEGPFSDSYTEDTANATPGPWLTLTRGGTNASPASVNQKVAGARKIVTGTTPQTWAPRFTSRDWAGVLVVFAPTSTTPASAPPLSPRRRRRHLLVR